MEIIYHCANGKYPFHRPHHAKAYVEYLVPLNSPHQAQIFRHTTTLLKSLDCPYLLRLVKVLSDEKEVHCLYEHFETSLEDHLSQVTAPDIASILEQIKSVLAYLTETQIKAKISLDNVAVDHSGIVKLFFSPEIEILCQNDCQEHYATEFSRVRFDIEELC